MAKSEQKRSDFLRQPATVNSRITSPTELNADPLIVHKSIVILAQNSQRLIY